MTFIKCSLKTLQTINAPNAYAGGSEATSLEQFKRYIRGKTSYGHGDPSRYRYCYYAYTRVAIEAEDALLQAGFEHNKHEWSNLKSNGEGYVYVCTYGQRLFVRK